MRARAARSWPVGLGAGRQEHVPGVQRSALGVSFVMVWGTDVLDAVVGAAGVSQTEVHGQLGHDAGGRDFTVDGVGDDRGTQCHHRGGLIFQ